MTIKEKAQKGILTPEIEACAKEEKIPPEKLLKLVAKGKAVFPANRRAKLTRPCAIGAGLRTKVNANIGTSRDIPDVEPELEKLRVALEAGADTIMDLSTGGPLDEIRRLIRENCPVP